MVNRYVTNLQILPEDEETRSIATGFIDDTKIGAQIEVLRPAGGWPKVLDQFVKDYQYQMEEYSGMHMVLLIDFDENFPQRLNDFTSQIPTPLRDRVFVLGALGEAEDARNLSQLSISKLGQALANECRNNCHNHWNNNQLSHNRSECQRLLAKLPNFLF